MSAEIITRERLDKIIATSNKKPIILDFFATWCGPCQMILPVFDALADELKDTHILVKINVDEQKEFSQEYGVSSIPTLVTLQNGKEVDRHVGYIDEESLKEFVKK